MHSLEQVLVVKDQIRTRIELVVKLLVIAEFRKAGLFELLSNSFGRQAGALAQFPVDIVISRNDDDTMTWHGQLGGQFLQKPPRCVILLRLALFGHIARDHDRRGVQVVPVRQTVQIVRQFGIQVRVRVVSLRVTVMLAKLQIREMDDRDAARHGCVPVVGSVGSSPSFVPAPTPGRMVRG